jgi:hypothetical protein
MSSFLRRSIRAVRSRRRRLAPFVSSVSADRLPAAPTTVVVQ